MVKLSCQSAGIVGVIQEQKLILEVFCNCQKQKFLLYLFCIYVIFLFL